MGVSSSYQFNDATDMSVAVDFQKFQTELEKFHLEKLGVLRPVCDYLNYVECNEYCQPLIANGEVTVLWKEGMGSACHAYPTMYEHAKKLPVDKETM